MECCPGRERGALQQRYPNRRPLFQSLVAEGTLPPGYATDDGAGVLYRGTEFVEALTEKKGKAAYLVERGPDGAVETRLETRLLR